MVKKRATADTIVGLFIFLGIVAINLVTFVIRDDLFGGTLKFKVRFDSVSGLEVGAPVLVSGIRAGRVAGIDYEVRGPSLVPSASEKPVIVTIVVDEDIPIYANARIRLVQQGFVGDRRVEIDPGYGELSTRVTSTSPPLPGQSQFDMERVMRQAELMVDDLQGTVAGFREFVSTESNLMQIGEAIGNLNLSLQKIQDYLVANEEDIRVSVANLRVASDNMRRMSDNAVRFVDEGGAADQIADDIRQTLADFRAEVERLASQTEDTVESMRTTVSNLDARTERVTQSAVTFLDSTQGDFAALSENLQATSSNLDILITRVRRGEGTVGRLFTDPTPFEDLKRSIQALHNFIVGERSRYLQVDLPYELPLDSPLRETDEANAAGTEPSGAGAGHD